MATSTLGRVHIPRINSTPCVCGICNCGIHHCPGIPERFPFEAGTTYRSEYVGKQVDHQPAYAPRSNPIITPAPSSHFLTTNQVYAVRDISPERARPILPQSTLQRPSTPFNSSTTQRTDYPGYRNVQRTMSAPPRRAMEPASSSFCTFETTNQAMQGPVANAVRLGVHRPIPTIQQATLVTSHTPLEASTTYKEYYPPRKSVYERLFRARKQLEVPPQAMIDDRDFRTTKALHYPAYGTLNLSCPAKPYAKRPPSTDGHISIRT